MLFLLLLRKNRKIVCKICINVQKLRIPMGDVNCLNYDFRMGFSIRVGYLLRIATGLLDS